MSLRSSFVLHTLPPVTETYPLLGCPGTFHIDSRCVVLAQYIFTYCWLPIFSHHYYQLCCTHRAWVQHQQAASFHRRGSFASHQAHRSTPCPGCPTPSQSVSHYSHSRLCLCPEPGLNFIHSRRRAPTDRPLSLSHRQYFCCTQPVVPLFPPVPFHLAWSTTRPARASILGTAAHDITPALLPPSPLPHALHPLSPNLCHEAASRALLKSGRGLLRLAPRDIRQYGWKLDWPGGQQLQRLRKCDRHARLRLLC